MPSSPRSHVSPKRQLRINKASGIAVPLVLVGFATYVSYVNIGVICDQYLLHPSQHLSNARIPKRTGAATAVIVLHFLFLSLWLACHARMLQTIATNPGYIPAKSLPAQDDRKGGEKRPMSFRHSCTVTHVEEDDPSVGSKQALEYDRVAILTGKAKLPPGAESLWSKEAFECDYQGLPNFCTTCNVYKPDRAHHSSDVARCTRRMDHFCPWVGGMVCERNYKFFVQYLVYAFFFSVFVLVVPAYYYANMRQRSRATYPPYKEGHLIAALSIGAVFTFFTMGMLGNTLPMIFLGVTTVENLDRTRRIYSIAVLRPPSVNFTGHTITYPLWSPAGPSSRTFAVLESRPGTRPWDLGWSRNWHDLMGESLWDWCLPLRTSPFCRRDRSMTEYEFGPALERMKREAGFV